TRAEPSPFSAPGHAVASALAQSRPPQLPVEQLSSSDMMRTATVELARNQLSSSTVQVKPSKDWRMPCSLPLPSVPASMALANLVSASGSPLVINPLRHPTLVVGTMRLFPIALCPLEGPVVMTAI